MTAVLVGEGHLDTDRHGGEDHVKTQTQREDVMEDGGRNQHAASRSWKSEGRIIPGAS